MEEFSWELGEELSTAEERAELRLPSWLGSFLQPTGQTPQVSARKKFTGFHSVVPSEDRSCPPRASVPAQHICASQKALGF